MIELALYVCNIQFYAILVASYNHYIAFSARFTSKTCFAMTVVDQGRGAITQNGTPCGSAFNAIYIGGIFQYILACKVDISVCYLTCINAFGQVLLTFVA